jgi:hypothetical protein
VVKCQRSIIVFFFMVRSCSMLVPAAIVPEVSLIVALACVE